MRNRTRRKKDLNANVTSLSGKLELSDKQYETWMAEIKNGHDCIRKYGNWAVSPWVIQLCGRERVEKELQIRFGKEYRIRVAHYYGTYMSESITYYILERGNA